ncbi:MAG: coniferyl aldehyde dehydrogenase [Pseudomonadales bacterium]|nr:coniferyl aldehyde dehydrogenase [Pseudomonadales bacterium]MBP9033377.1 coniferyl aldehyde dehydrogenase [Pseudomonadales bacterium]
MTTAAEQAGAVIDARGAMLETLELQRKAFRAEGFPEYGTRIDRIDRCIALLVDNQKAICDALSADYGCRSPYITRMAEIMTSVGNLKHVRKKLKSWMKPERRSAPVPMNLFGARALVYHQPKGVVGNMTPWNIPVGMVFSPMADILGAGNRVMIKPSEFTPQTSALTRELINRYFDRSEIAVLTGGPEVGAAFASLPFDHLLFTGATSIGRMVMRAAAENLTPVTLELGGKSPVIVSASADIEEAAGKIVTGKGQNAGQLCICPDYAFVPESRLEVFLESCRKNFVAQYPTTVLNPDYNAMINARHYDRVLGYIEEARAAGARIIELNPGREDFTDRAQHKIPLHIVVNPDDALKVMQEEIFGPVLVVKTYRDVGDCIAYVNARARPLALYWFGKDEAERERVLRETISGGVSVNNVMMHFACDDLPFGGVGGSGMGHYHGRDGFRTFSHAKGVFRDGRLNLSKLAGTLPPFGPKIAKMLDGQIRK